MGKMGIGKVGLMLTRMRGRRRDVYQMGCKEENNDIRKSLFNSKDMCKGDGASCLKLTAYDLDRIEYMPYL
jgi:hypothetical protein